MRCLAPFKKDTPQKITSTEFALGVLQIFRSNSNGRLKTNDWVSLLSPKTKTKCLCYQRPRPVRYHPGLYHFRHRDYSPTLGRWTSLDPLRYDAEDVNLYRALGNNTLIRFDPYGLEWSWGGAIGGMFSGGIVGAGVGATVGAPFFGIGALPGAIAGGAVGAIGGFIAGGALTEPAYTAITGNPDPQLLFWEEFGMGFVIGIPVGVVAGIVGPAGWSLYTGAFWTSTTAYYLGLAAPGATMTVSHWGKPGVGPGSWVMVGRPDWLSWLLAGGPQVGPYSSGLAYQVPIQSVVTPYGGGAPWYEWIKFWQRMII